MNNFEFEEYPEGPLSHYSCVFCDCIISINADNKKVCKECIDILKEIIHDKKIVNGAYKDAQVQYKELLKHLSD
jgi:hypothetical protein